MLSSCIRVKRVILRIEVFVVSTRFVLYLYLFDYLFFFYSTWLLMYMASFIILQL